MYESQREEMIKRHLIPRGIKDKEVLRAMREVPRHVFVPAGMEQKAYADYPLSIGEGQTISQPYIVAYMTERLRISPSNRILEIGSGSGYQAAILALLAKKVYTVEIKENLALKARKTLDSLGIKNVRFEVGDGYYGLEEQAPFDRIILTAAPHEIPAKLVEQLSVGGIMVLPVGSDLQKLVELRKTDKACRIKDLMAVRFVPMVENKI